jgi:hypothetical protein
LLVFSNTLRYVLILDTASTLQASTSMDDTKLRRPFLLPPAIRACYEEQLAHCQRVWETTQDPLAVAEAITWTHHYRQPIEPWVEEAAVRALARVRSKAQTRRHRDNMRDFDRYCFIRDAVDGGMTWDRAKKAASKKFRVDIETVWSSYKRIKRQFRERQTNRFRYWVLKDIRYRHLG